MSPDRNALSLLRRRVYCCRVIQMGSVLVILSGVLSFAGGASSGAGRSGQPPLTTRTPMVGEIRCGSEFFVLH